MKNPNAPLPVMNVLIYPGDFVGSIQFWWIAGFAKERSTFGNKKLPLHGWMIVDANGDEHFIAMHDLKLHCRGNDELECARWQQT